MESATLTQLARAAGVSRQTLARWLKPHTAKLKELGYKKGAKVLNPAIVEYITRNFCIEIH